MFNDEYRFRDRSLTESGFFEDVTKADAGDPHAGSYSDGRIPVSSSVPDPPFLSGTRVKHRQTGRPYVVTSCKDGWALVSHCTGHSVNWNSGSNTDHQFLFPVTDLELDT